MTFLFATSTPAMALAQDLAPLGSPPPATPPPAPAAPLAASSGMTAPSSMPPAPESRAGDTLWSRLPNGLSAKFSAGATYRRIFSIPLAGAELGLALGGQHGISGIYGGADITLGTTQFGLATTLLHTSATYEARLGRLHLGAGVAMGYLAIKRITTGQIMDTLGGGLSAFGSYDLFDTDSGHALYLSAKVSGDWMPTQAFVWGPSLGLGVRL